MAAPLYAHLARYARKNRISFAMPGHKNGRGLRNGLTRLDVTELAETENLYCGGEYVRGANRLLSRLYGSGRSFILTGGSTAAIQAMICGAVGRGGELLASADCHMSVINACTLLGINIRFFPKEIRGGAPLGTDTVKKYLTGGESAVILTSPNYYGIVSDIKNIARECHENNIPLLVDEAHGAHFIASPHFPETAVHFADAVCHSAHKTLNAMNGAAYLHLNGSLIDADRAERALSMFQSTSPSYVIASTADTAREELENGAAWERTREMCVEFRAKMTRLGVRVLENDDITRVVLNFSDLGMTGFDAERSLAEHGIDIEMADLYSIVLIVTPSNTRDDLERLAQAAALITANPPADMNRTAIPPPPVCAETLSPSESFWAEREEIPLAEAAGRVSCDTVVPYPPGVPVICTGGRVRAEQIEYINYILKAGGEISGLTDGKIGVTVK